MEQTEQGQQRDDSTLIRQYVAEKSEAAFAQLMHRYLDFVYTLCWRYLHDSDLADDATQLVFLHLSRKAATVPQQGEALAGWLFQTTQFVCRNLRRQQTRRTDYETRAAQQWQEGRTDSSPSVRDDPEFSIAPCLLSALEKLRPDERDLLFLRFFYEHDYLEIARLRGISVDAARMRVNRALKQLRAHLAKSGDVLLSEERQTLPPRLIGPLLIAPIHLQPSIGVQQTYKGILRKMRIRQSILAALSLAGLVLIVVGITGTRTLRAANTFDPPGASPAAPPTASAPATKAQEPAQEKTPRSVIIKVRVLERTATPGTKNKVTENLLQAPILSTINDMKASVKLSDKGTPPRQSYWETSVVPHLNEDGTINLQIQWQEEHHTVEEGDIEDTRKVLTMETKRRVRSGKEIRISLFKSGATELVMALTAQEQIEQHSPTAQP